MKNEYIKLAISFLGGGFMGALFKHFVDCYKNKMQIMECHYVDDDTISKIPINTESGERHENIYAKQFVLKNTTNIDHKSFKITFEFDNCAKILKHSNQVNSEINSLKNRIDNNKCIVTIVNFNRDDEIIFIFEIANLTVHAADVRADGLGFKVVLRDKRKKKEISKLTILNKSPISIANN